MKLIDVYPNDYPDPEGTSSGNKRILSAPPLHMGGYQQLLRGRAVPRQVPQQLGKAGAADAGEGDEISNSRCRT